jgi:hypothetical protein
MNAQTTAETLALMKGALAEPDNDISKSITQATNLVAFDLQGPAKNLYPVFTPLRNSIPRVGGGVGLATNWRVVSSIIGSGFDSTGWVPEGKRAGVMSYTTAAKAASYATIGEEDNVTFEAVNAGRSFEDVRATMAIRLLQKMMLKEEMSIIAGNVSVTVAAPATPTLAAVAGTTALAATAYNVYCVSLTLEGYFNSAVSAVGVATTKSVTPADGSTAFTVKGGSSTKSPVATITPAAGQAITATVASVSGAVAYAWYFGASGAELLVAITTINSVSISAIGVGTQNASAITADNTTNTTGSDGLLYTAFKSASGAINTVMPIGTVGVGTPLTSSGRGSVVEIDALLQSMWDSYQLGATVIYCNSQEIKNITTKIMAASGSGSLLRVNTDGKSPYGVTAGGVVNNYFNPFMPGGGQIIPVRIHPKLPPGTIMAYCEELPIYYQNNEVQNVAEVITRQDYYQIDWPVRSRQYESGVYSEQVLAVYCPFAVATITNIANG